MDYKPQRYVTKNHHNPPYPMPFSSSSSRYSYFSDQAMKVGSSSGTIVIEGQVGLNVLRGPVDTSEMIRRDLEKERIRMEIIEEEINRKRVLEAEVRRELMIEGELALHCSGGFSSSFMPGPSCRHRYEFESGMVYNQSFSPEYRRIEMPYQEMYGGRSSGGGHHRDFRGIEVAPSHSSPPKIREITTTLLPEEDKKEVFIGLGMPDGAKRKLPPPPPPPPSQRRSNSLRKKSEDEFSCAVCKISATSEHGFNEHLAGKKHLAKTAALRARDNGAGSGVKRSKKSVKRQSLGINKKSTKCVKVQRKNTNRTRN